MSKTETETDSQTQTTGKGCQGEVGGGGWTGSLGLAEATEWRNSKVLLTAQGTTFSHLCTKEKHKERILKVCVCVCVCVSL